MVFVYFFLYIPEDYRFTRVDLVYNKLTRFEEGAFKSMLQDTSTGTVSLDINQSYM